MPRYCSKCDGEVGEYAQRCEHCDVDFGGLSSYRIVYRKSPPTSLVFWATLISVTPYAAFLGTFGVLCAVECLVLPWFTILIGPVSALVCTFGVRQFAKRAKKKREMR